MLAAAFAAPCCRRTPRLLAATQPAPLLRAPPCATGLDSAEIVSQLRAAHAADPDSARAGVDVVTGGVGDMQQVRLADCEAVQAGTSLRPGRRRALHAAVASVPSLAHALPPTPTCLPLPQLGIFEAFKVKHAALLSATEAAEQILRVDDIIKAAPRQRDGGM